MGVLREIADTIKTDHDLALALYASGVHEGMMLAGMICDPRKLSRETLDLWAKLATCTMVSDRCVALLAAVRADAWEIADSWIGHQEEMTACAGYAVYGMLFAHLSDDQLDLDRIRRIVDRIESSVKSEKPYLQYAMNNCLIMAGMYVGPLSMYCLEAADRIGYIKPTRKVNSCNIQSASDYIRRYAPRKKTKQF